MHYSKEYKIKFLYQQHPESTTRQSITQTQTGNGHGTTSRISYHSALSKPSSASSSSVKRINQIHPKQPMQIQQHYLDTNNNKNLKDRQTGQTNVGYKNSQAYKNQHLYSNTYNYNFNNYGEVLPKFKAFRSQQSQNQKLTQNIVNNGHMNNNNHKQDKQSNTKIKKIKQQKQQQNNDDEVQVQKTSLNQKQSQQASSSSILGQFKGTNTNSIDYKSNIKPMFGFQKYMVLCGMERGHSANGCSCYSPCKWNKLWTSNYTPKNHKLYTDMLKLKPQKANIQQINKDIHRTFPDCPTYSRNQQYSQKLKQVLTVYSIYDPQVGYAQGMNMIAAILLYHIKSAQHTFWAMVDLMDEQQLRMIYIQQFKHLKKHCSILNKLLTAKLPDLWQHIQSKMDITPDIFYYGWLLGLMSSCIPLQYMHLVLEKFRNTGWKFVYQLILTYLVFLKERLLIAEDSAQFLMAVNCESSKQIGLHWQEMIQNCYKVQL